MKTEKGTLDFGIEYPADSGEMHYDFDIRLATVGDNIVVYESPEILGGGVANMRVTAALIAQSLISLGTIPKESITAALIDSMVDSDYDMLVAAQEALKKKLKRPKPADEVSALPDSSLDSTASAKSDISVSPLPS